MTLQQIDNVQRFQFEVDTPHCHQVVFHYLIFFKVLATPTRVSVAKCWDFHHDEASLRHCLVSHDKDAKAAIANGSVALNTTIIAFKLSGVRYPYICGKA